MRTITAKASARKSTGEYKPIVVIGNKTTVVEQNPERFDVNTRNGVVKGNKFARGNTYPTREDAIAAAQRYIDFRLEEATARFNKYGVDKIKREMVLWGYKEA